MKVIEAESPCQSVQLCKWLPDEARAAWASPTPPPLGREGKEGWREGREGGKGGRDGGRGGREGREEGIN